MDEMVDLLQSTETVYFDAEQSITSSRSVPRDGREEYYSLGVRQFSLMLCAHNIYLFLSERR